MLSYVILDIYTIFFHKNLQIIKIHIAIQHQKIKRNPIGLSSDFNKKFFEHSVLFFQFSLFQ